MKKIPMRSGAFAIAALSLGAATSGALAQEAMYTAAATMPSPGTFVDKPMVHYWKYGPNPNTGEGDTHRFSFENSLAYGIARDWAAYLDLDADYDSTDQPGGGSDSEFGIDRVEALIKWRFYKSDTGGIDTLRAALIGGVHLELNGDVEAHPKIGGVVTIVRGRLGFNQDLFYTLGTGGDKADNFGGEGPDDAISHSSALVYRIWPDRFQADSRGAWYVTGELTGLYETNGDYELKVAPGLMYEGYRWAFETMAQVPVYQDVNERPELRWGVGVGFRFSF